ncbi:hypothetical protein ACIOWI_19785 [Streptomyces sp. NPDC087659]|uniref:hypothetical protein n=1 Tax=Streptomyces sp. NPDC087659 TaxID=3365801 RepID=UPI0037FEB52C
MMAGPAAEPGGAFGRQQAGSGLQDVLRLLGDERLLDEGDARRSLSPVWYGKSVPSISRSAPYESAAARRAGAWPWATVS